MKIFSNQSLCTKVGTGDSKLPFDDNSVDLLTCCQAIHWFDLSKFYQEVDRVLKQQKGALAIIGYHLTGPSPNLPAAKRLEELRDKVCLLFAYLCILTLDYV